VVQRQVYLTHNLFLHAWPRGQHLWIFNALTFFRFPEAPLRPEARGICHSCHMANPALTSTILVTLILVPDRRSGTNSCKIATTRSEFYAIYVIYLYYTSDSRLYTYSTVSFFLLMPPKDLAPFLIKVSKVIKYELTIDCIWLYTQPAMCIASFFSYIYPQKTSFNDKV